MPNSIRRFMLPISWVILITLLLTVMIFVSHIFFNRQPSRKHPNILLVLIDATRQDHLGCYGYDKNTSPNIDNIAHQGALFTDCYTVASWTNPVLISLFTGLYPQSVLAPDPFLLARKHKLPEGIDTLAGILHDNGYHTAALIDHVGFGKQLEYGRGFEDYTCNRTVMNYLQSSDMKILWKQVVDLFKKHENEKFFIYLHLMYVHQPYVLLKPDGKTSIYGDDFKNLTPENKDEIIEAYDQEIRRNDIIIGGIFNHLKRTGLSDNTYIIIMADHGEGFWEHGAYEHGKNLYNEVLKIPLVIYTAGDKRIEGLRIGGVASDIDIFPTILDMAGVRSRRAVDGISLLSYIKKGKNLPDRLVFSESPHSDNINAITCENSRYKLIYSPPKGIRISYLTMLKDVTSGRNCQLYDLLNDPAETVNIASKEHFKTFILGLQILFHKIKNDMRRNKIRQETVGLTDNDLRRLRSLGYVQ